MSLKGLEYKNAIQNKVLKLKTSIPWCW